MIAALRHWLRRRLLTPEERTLLNADRRAVLRAMLSPEQWQLVAALEEPLAWAPDAQFTASEAEALQQFYASALGRKLEAAMNSWLIATGQQALAAPSAELVAHAKFAWGCRAGWEMSRTISRLAAADRSAEETATTGAADLEQHLP